MLLSPIKSRWVFAIAVEDRWVPILLPLLIGECCCCRRALDGFFNEFRRAQLAVEIVRFHEDRADLAKKVVPIIKATDGFLTCLRKTLVVGVFLITSSIAVAGGFGLQMSRSDGHGFPLLRTLMQRCSSVRHRRSQPPTIIDLCRLHAAEDEYGEKREKVREEGGSFFIMARFSEQSPEQSRIDCILLARWL
ncbi:hypothetical protein ACLOJK_013711 [Asimina triloba]